MDNPGHYDEYPELTRLDKAMDKLPASSSAASPTPSPISDQAAGEPVAWSAKQLYDAIEKILLSYQLSNWQDQYDSALGLVDRLCDHDAKDIASGQHQVRLICDEIYNEVLTVAAPTTGSTPETRPYQIQCESCGHLDYYVTPASPAPSDVIKPREVKRDSDFSVTVVFSSCRLASEFERQMIAAVESQQDNT